MQFFIVRIGHNIHSHMLKGLSCYYKLSASGARHRLCDQRQSTIDKAVEDGESTLHKPSEGGHYICFILHPSATCLRGTVPPLLLELPRSSWGNQQQGTVRTLGRDSFISLHCYARLMLPTYAVFTTQHQIKPNQL